MGPSSLGEDPPQISSLGQGAQGMKGALHWKEGQDLGVRDWGGEGTVPGLEHGRQGQPPHQSMQGGLGGWEQSLP